MCWNVLCRNYSGKDTCWPVSSAASPFRGPQTLALPFASCGEQHLVSKYAALSRCSSRQKGDTGWMSQCVLYQLNTQMPLENEPNKHNSPWFIWGFKWCHEPSNTSPGSPARDPQTPVRGRADRVKDLIAWPKDLVGFRWLEWRRSWLSSSIIWYPSTPSWLVPKRISLVRTC